MFSHIMVGTNDPDRSRDFYNRLFEKEGGTDDKGRTAWRNKGSVFMISKPINGEPACHANGGTIGFNFDSPEEVDAWHRRGVEAVEPALHTRRDRCRRTSYPVRSAAIP